MYKSKVIKNSNRDRILECIYRNPGFSRKDISDMTGITPATVTTTVAAMVAEGMITQLGRVEEDKGTIGRSRIALDINASFGCVIGVEFTVEALTTCATDLHGKIIYTHSIPHTTEVGENITRLVIRNIQQCIDSIPGPKEKIAGIGIAVPGHMDERQRRLVSNRGWWKNFDGDAISKAFAYPVVFENNVRCMAVSRYLHDPRNTPSSFALFHVGHGMFCANIADDELYIGTTYGSGEIAHTIAVPDGKRCNCGKKGCLQTVATEAALLEGASIIFESDESSLLHNCVKRTEDLSIEHIARAYRMGEPSIRRLVTQALKYLCISTLNIAVLMNPEKLFLHGKLFNDEAICQDLLEMIHEQFEFTKNSYNLGTVEVLTCHPSDGAVGAAALVILRCICHA